MKGTHLPRDAHSNRRPLLWPRVNRDLPFYEARALLDAHETEPPVIADASRIESPAIVGNRQHKAVALLGETQRDLLRLSVPSPRS